MTWADFLDSVTFDFPFPVEIRAQVSRYDETELRVTLTVPDTRTGLISRVHTIDYAPPFIQMEDPAGYLRAQILRALAHEVDECLKVHGKLARDPHALTDPSGAFQPRFL